MNKTRRETQGKNTNLTQDEAIKPCTQEECALQKWQMTKCSWTQHERKYDEKAYESNSTEN